MKSCFVFLTNRIEIRSSFDLERFILRTLSYYFKNIEVHQFAIVFLFCLVTQFCISNTIPLVDESLESCSVSSLICFIFSVYVACMLFPLGSPTELDTTK